jgi:hypothetical protein
MAPEEKKGVRAAIVCRFERMKVTRMKSLEYLFG